MDDDGSKSYIVAPLTDATCGVLEEEDEDGGGKNWLVGEVERTSKKKERAMYNTSN